MLGRSVSRSVGHSRTFSDILGHSRTFTGLVIRVSCQWAMQMQMQMQMQMSPWLGVPVPDVTWLQCIMVDVFEVHVFLSLGPWPMGHDVWFFSFRAFCLLCSHLDLTFGSSRSSRCRCAHILHVSSNFTFAPPDRPRSPTIL